MKPRVAIIAPALLPIPPVKGGAVEELVNLIVLQNEVEKKLDLTVISVYDDTAYRESLKYPNTTFIWIKYNIIQAKVYNRLLRHIYLPLKKEPFYNYFRYRVIRLLQKENFDKVILESNADFVNILGSKIGKDKLYCHMHILPGMVKGTFDGCKCVLAVSEYIRHQIIRQSNKPATEVLVFKNSINEDRFNLVQNRRKEMRSRLGLDDESIAICYTGRIVPQKGVRELLEAFIRLHDSKVHLFIIGSLGGNFKDSKEQTPFVKELLGIYKKYNGITFTGYVDNDSLPNLLSAMDIAVMPSFYNEAAALNNVEYQAMGLPVITTNSGGIPEYMPADSIILNPDGTFVNNLVEQLDILIKNPDKREEYRRLNLDNAKNYTKENYYKRLISLLK